MEAEVKSTTQLSWRESKLTLPEYEVSVPKNRQRNEMFWLKYMKNSFSLCP
jgi:hypothetical protein